MGLKDFINKKFNFGSDDEPENIPTAEDMARRWADQPQDQVPTEKPPKKGKSDG